MFRYKRSKNSWIQNISHVVSRLTLSSGVLGIWCVFGRYSLVDPISYAMLTLTSASIITFCILDIAKCGFN